MRDYGEFPCLAFGMSSTSSDEEDGGDGNALMVTPDVAMRSKHFRHASQRPRGMHTSPVVHEDMDLHSQSYVGDEVGVPDTHDEGLDDMMDAFFRPSKSHVHVMSEFESIMHELQSTPLYDGSSMSKLHACLSILNLQATYGWADTSVSTLLR